MRCAHSKLWQVCGETRRFIYCRRYVKWKSGSFLIKVKILLPCEPMTVPLVFTQRFSQLYTQTYTWIFSSVLFILITAHTWKKPTYPLIIEWRNKLCYIQNMEYYSALRWNEVSSHKKTLRSLKCILLNEKSKWTHTGWLQLYDIWSSVLIGGGQEGMNRQSSGDIQGSKNTLYDTTLMSTYQNTFAQTHWKENTKWNIRWAIKFGWLWYAYLGLSSVITNVQFW